MSELTAIHRAFAFICEATNATAPHERNRFGKSLPAVLEEVGQIVQRGSVESTVTDWPFENFWANPYEPKHSKFLKYLLDPEEPHRCGAFLLQGFLDAIKGQLPWLQPLVASPCRVHQPNDIDLLIEWPNKEYAIIIENKINWARDQPKQLETYVRSLLQRGFRRERICVLYLPLNESKDPDTGDVAIVREVLKVSCRKITFKSHVLNWLDDVLSDDAEWPSKTPTGMRQNLSHYRNLINYLINRENKVKMNRNVLKELEQAENNNNNLPLNWTEVELLQKASAELKTCFESVLRGKLLLRVQDLLKTRGLQGSFFNSEGEQELRAFESAYDERFQAEVNLSIRVNESVQICFGGYPEEDPGCVFWIGYMKSGDKTEAEKLEKAILKEAEEQLLEVKISKWPWYCWAWYAQAKYSNCLEESTAHDIMAKLLQMYEGLTKEFAGK